jgi:hypothetical protein
VRGRTQGQDVTIEGPLTKQGQQHTLTVRALRFRKLATIGSSAASGIGTRERSKLSKLGNTFKKSLPLLRAAAARAFATSAGSWSVTFVAFTRP